MKKKTSILERILIPLTVVILAQGIFFMAFFRFGGTLPRMQENAIRDYDSTVENRKVLLEETMMRWSNLSGKYEKINQELLTYFEKDEEFLNDGEEINTFLYQNLQDLVYVLRKNSVTGAFLLLDSETESKQGIYIRDMDPLSNPSDNSDLLIELGPSSLMRRIDIPMDTEWRGRLDPEEVSSMDFYIKPTEAANQYNKLAYTDLGYWSSPFRLSKNDLEIITYTVPLYNLNHEAVGVLGVEIALDVFLKQLPSYELNSENQGGYYLASKISNEQFQKVAVSGYRLKNLLNNNDSQMQIKGHEILTSVAIIENTDETTFGCRKAIKMYNTNTPFEQESWVLFGIQPKKVLYQNVDEIQKIAIVSTVACTAFALFLMFFIATHITTPIRKLAKVVREADPNHQLSLGSTQIREMDDLALAIENMSKDIASASNKYARIIEMVNISLGTYEYRNETDGVYCTPYCLKVLELPESDTAITIDRSLFEERMTHLMTFEDLDEKNVAKLVKGKEDIYIRISDRIDKEQHYGVIQDVSTQMREKKRIEYQRDHDILTQLYNRRAFRRMVNELLTKEKIGIAAMMTWDLDSLKFVNDNYGHDMGDRYLKLMSEVLSDVSSPNYISARMSGDEFYVFMWGYRTTDEIREVIADMKQKVFQQILNLPDGKQMRLRASGGVAWYPENGEIYDSLIRYADYAMYKVKNTIKGDVREFNEEEYKKDAILFDNHEDLNELIDNHAIEHVIQPIVNAKDGSILGYEALMRSLIPSFKGAEEILRVARSQSKLNQIERMTVFSSMEKLVQEFPETDELIFINSIPSEIMALSDCEEFYSLYHNYLHRMVIEITENDVCDEDTMKLKMDVTEAWNAYVAIDDYGSGYNGEVMLLNLKPTYLKIDYDIIHNIEIDVDRQAMLLNTVNYAKKRGISVVAEGVETKAQMECCIQLGVDYLQGYYLAPPSIKKEQMDNKIVLEIKEINRKLKG